MLNNNIHINAGAYIGIKNGIDKIADAVKLTIGSAGANAVIEETLNPGFVITNDGYSILQKATFEDPLEELGRRILFDSVSRANKQSGDGSTTTTILTQAILNEGNKVQASPMEIKRSLDELLPLIEEKIDAQKKMITEDEVAAVAAISAEDSDLGAIIQDIYKQIGKEGIIELDNSKTFDTHYEIKEGVRFQCGLISPYMASNGTAEYSKPFILVARTRIAVVGDVIPVIDKIAATGKKEIVIFCDDISDSVTSTLIMNHMKGVFNILIVKAPTIWKEQVFEDFAMATGSALVSEKTGLSFKNVTLEHLGSCDKILVTKDETTLLGIKDVSAHVEKLKAEATDESMRRVAWLTTKAAVLKLGANSESELSYKRLKAEDAINAARLALEDGVVVGGGLALANVSLDMPDTIGGIILRQALMSPMRQIMQNAGAIADPRPYGGVVGFDATSKEMVDMWKAKIIDPAKVVKNAVRNAISVAGTALTIRIAIPQDRTEEQVARNFISRQQQQF